MVDWLEMILELIDYVCEYGMWEMFLFKNL